MDFFTLSQQEYQALMLSLKVSLCAVAGSLPFGIATAWLLARRNFPGKTLVDALVHLPLVVPPIVTGYVLLVLFGRQGVVGSFLYETFGITLAFTWRGAVMASAVMAFPLMVRAVRLSIEGVDRRLESAAKTLGAERGSVFFTITLPLITPGIITGTLLAFARALSEFGATITFVSNIEGQTQTLPLALFTMTQVPGGEAGAMRLCLISVGVAIAALTASEFLSKRFEKQIKG
ncbi:molybdate ABC transporter permease [Desulfoluna limicola]|uniref:Molybdenum transport system permease n=1 Tax=Desulfoluna limicola TaxID=2810562 RepID=A0ABM7PFW3_9BACT|nr:molybdate ABC transporter permease subunit [Desulfoluna limicola]BCS95968.1 molybdate ABC transporter permease [Desulfoluna limicola]